MFKIKRVFIEMIKEFLVGIRGYIQFQVRGSLFVDSVNNWYDWGIQLVKIYWSNILLCKILSSIMLGLQSELLLYYSMEFNRYLVFFVWYMLLFFNCY